MKIKAIMFDKDGTLMDFDSFWVTVSRYALEQIIEETGTKGVTAEEALVCLDVTDGVADINGILAQDPFPVMGAAINAYLRSYGCSLTDGEMTELTVKAYHENVTKGIVTPTCDHLPRVLDRLRDMGLRLALITTDDPYDTKSCLERLGVYELFDEIYTDDGVFPPKPDPYCAKLFCDKYGFTPDELLMVGDTMNDVRFAVNSGIGFLGVAKGEKNRAVLVETGQKTVNDVSCIFDCLE